MSDEETEFIYTQQYLENKNKEFYEQIKKLKEVLEMKNQQLEQLNDKTNSLSIELEKREKAYVEILKKEQSEVDSQEQQTQQTKKKIQEYQSEIKAYQLNNQQQKDKIETLQKEINSTGQKQIKLDEEIKNLKKNTKLKEEQLKAIQKQLDIQKKKYEEDNAKNLKKLSEKEKILQTYEQKNSQMEQQTQQLIEELIEYKNNQLNSSTHGKDLNVEMKKLNEENQKIKLELKKIQRQNEDYIKENHILKERENKISNKYNELEKDILGLLQNFETDKTNYLDKVQELQNTQKENIDLKCKVEQLTKDLKSYKSNCDDEKQMDQFKQMNFIKNELMEKDNELKKQYALIKDLMNMNGNKKDDQNVSKKEIEALKTELKNLQSFIYECPVEILFNLLEDRLTKQLSKAPQQNPQKKNYWKEQLKGWQSGLQELKDNFKKIGVTFSYTLQEA